MGNRPDALRLMDAEPVLPRGLQGGAPSFPPVCGSLFRERRASLHHHPQHGDAGQAVLLRYPVGTHTGAHT